jgi:putative oxidoreductase
MITERQNSSQIIRYDNESAMTKPFTDYSTGIFLLRLVLGIVFIAHGGQKVFGWFGGPGLQGTVDFMSGMGIPAGLAYGAAFTEFLGGIALILGLLTRVAALGIAIVMLTAIAKVHLGEGFFAPKGYEFPLSLAVIAFTIFLVGPGRYSLDDKIFNRTNIIVTK